MKELIECEYSGVDIHGALVGFLRKILSSARGNEQGTKSVTKFRALDARSFVVIQTGRWTGIVDALRFVNSLKMVVYDTRSIHEYTFPPSLLKRGGQYIYHLLLHKISKFCSHKGIMITCYFLN